MPFVDAIKPIVSKIGEGINWIASTLSQYIPLEQAITRIIVLLVISIWIAGIFSPHRYKKYTRPSFWFIVAIVYFGLSWLGV